MKAVCGAFVRSEGGDGVENGDVVHEEREVQEKNNSSCGNCQPVFFFFVLYLGSIW